jgi:O-succinylbenzoate synthase
MKIERVALYHVRMKLQSAFETSFGRIETRDCILVEIGSEGVTGWGECVADRDPGYSEETSGTAWHILHDFLVPIVLGKEVSHPAEFHQLSAGVRGNPLAKAGLKMALWDVYGQQENQSLKTLLGGERMKVPVGVSIGIQESSEKLIETVAGYLEQGYRRVKIKIKPERDVGDTQAVREAYPELPLQVDANSAYTLRSAAALKPLDELDLLLIEQPLAEDDLWDHHYLQAEFNTPICLDESIRSVQHARQAIEMEATRVINIKAGRVGGLSQGVAIHDLCRYYDIPVWCGGMLETGVGRAANLALASLPNFTLPGDISATERYYEKDVTNEVFTLNSDSTIDVPNAPGLGVSINQQALEAVTLRKEEF